MLKSMKLRGQICLYAKIFDKMEVVKIGNPNICVCECCHTELKYNKYDLQWTHTEGDYYYIKCPICGDIVWVPGDERHHRMYHEAWDERIAKDLSN